jgi:hypothetical protein
MSDKPTGPWTYKGMIVDASNLTRGNHPGIIDFKGKSYCFGHSYDLLKQSTSTFYERRSVDMDEITYLPDGSISNRHYWSVEGPERWEPSTPSNALKPKPWPGAKVSNQPNARTRGVPDSGARR